MHLVIYHLRPTLLSLLVTCSPCLSSVTAISTHFSETNILNLYHHVSPYFPSKSDTISSSRQCTSNDDWGIRGKVTRTVIWCIVYDRCASDICTPEQFLPHDAPVYAVIMCLSICMFVHPSATSRYCTKTA